MELVMSWPSTSTLYVVGAEPFTLIVEAPGLPPVPVTPGANVLKSRDCACGLWVAERILLRARNHQALLRALGLEQGRVRAHRDGLRLRAHLQGHILPRCLGNLNRDALLDERAESSRFHAQLIAPRRQRRNGVVAGVRVVD